MKYLVILWLSVFGIQTVYAEPAKQTATFIPITPMMEFDGKTKKEIYDLRINEVAKYPQFAPAQYMPSDEIFGQITDGKPWWGIMGLTFYGPGKKSIAGEAEESRFILNPYLLVGLTSSSAYTVRDIQYPRATYPIPNRLVWNDENLFAGVRYDMTRYFRDAKARRMEYFENLTLVAYNARDFGYHFLQVSSTQSNNVVASPEIVPIEQFIHTGNSCGYADGCNNMSPFQQGLEISVNKLPALAYIKLWKNQPSDAEQAADIIFIIEML